MKGIDNSLVVDALCNSCSCAAFVPSVSYTMGVNGVTFTQASTFDAGDSLKRLRCEVFDKNGKMNSYMMSGAGSGATAGTVTFSAGAVTGVPVSAGGTGYTVPPRVTLTGGGGTGAVAQAVINSSGVVTSVVIVKGGTGYSSAPTATFVTNILEVPLGGTGYNDLDLTGGLTLKAFIVSTGGCKADLKTASLIQYTNASTGTLGNISEAGDNVDPGNN